MYTFILAVHCLLAVAITIAVLVQSGKGGGLGAGFGGGGANTLFGSSGGGNFFTKLTMCLAAGFMVTSLSLTALKSHNLKTSIFDNGGAPAPISAVPVPLATPANSAITPAAPVVAPKSNEQPAGAKQNP
jgi:preprotein translocase subunit SecG